MKKKEIRKLFERDAERFKLTPQKYQHIVEDMGLTKSNDEVQIWRRTPKLKLLMSVMVIILLTISLTLVTTVGIYESYGSKTKNYQEKYIEEGNQFLTKYCDYVQSKPVLANNIDSSYFINLFYGNNKSDGLNKYAIQIYRKMNNTKAESMGLMISNDLQTKELDFTIDKDNESFIYLLNTKDFIILSKDILEFKIFIDQIQISYFSFMTK